MARLVFIRLATWTHTGGNVNEDLVASFSIRQMVQVLLLPRGGSVCLHQACDLDMRETKHVK